MKSFILLAFFLVLGVVVSAESHIAVKKYILSTPQNVMAKCLKESDLEADKDKLLTDESTVDKRKLACFLACTLKEYDVLVNGEIKFDVFTEVLSKVLTNKEDKLQERLDVIKSCLPEGANSKDDCDKIGKILQCNLEKFKQMGI